MYVLVMSNEEALNSHLAPADPVTVMTTPAATEIGPGLIGISHLGSTLAAPNKVLCWDDFSREQYLAERESHAAEGRRVFGLYEHVQQCSRHDVDEDPWDMAAAGLSCALALSRTIALELVCVSVELIERLPSTAELLRFGWIGLAAARVIAGETFLVSDEVAKHLDKELVRKLAPTRRRLHPPRSGPLKRLLGRLIRRLDPVAARARAEDAREDLEVRIRPREDDLADMSATLPADWAAEIDRRLDEIVARSVPQPESSRGQLRAQARLAATRGWDSLAGSEADEGQARRVILHVFQEPDMSGQSGYHLRGFGPMSSLTGEALERTMRERHHEVSILADPAAPAALRYSPSTPLRLFVEGRDGTCVFPGCSTSAENCEIDHIEPFEPKAPEAGGRTTSDNLACLCKHHHERKTMGTYIYYRDNEGGYVWTPGPAHPGRETESTWRSEPTGPLAGLAAPVHERTVQRQREFVALGGSRGARLHRPHRSALRRSRRYRLRGGE